MTTTVTQPDRKPSRFDPAEYRALIATALDTIVENLPHLGELADSRQRGIGFLTPDAKAAINEQLRRERSARYPSTTATGAPIPVGLRGFVRPLATAAMPGERPVPVNLRAVSLAAEIPMTLMATNRRIRRQLAEIGVCHVKKPVDHPATGDVIDETRALVAVVAGKNLLFEIHRTVEDLAERSKHVVHGNDRERHPRPCPHCGLHTLVVYLDTGVIRCERDPHTGKYEACICPDSYCDCKVRHHRHEWTRNTNASRSNSWQGLNRAQDLAEREHQAKKDTTEGAPTVSYDHTHGQDPAVHRIEVERNTADEVTHARFVCTAAPTAPCRNYPSCECESWDSEVHPDPRTGKQPAPGHESVQQDECWLDPWLNNLDLMDFAESADPHLCVDELRDGPVEVSWEGDYLLWRYADQKVEVSA